MDGWFGGDSPHQSSKVLLLAQPAPLPNIPLASIKSTLPDLPLIPTVLHEEINLINDVVHNILRNLLLIPLPNRSALLPRPPPLPTPPLAATRLSIPHFHILRLVAVFFDRDGDFGAADMSRRRPEPSLSVAEIHFCRAAEEA